MRVLAVSALAATSDFGESASQDRLVLAGEPVRTDEVPPRDLLPLAHASLVRAGEERHQPGDEEDGLHRLDHLHPQDLLKQDSLKTSDGEGSGRMREGAEQGSVGAAICSVEPRVGEVGVDQVVLDPVGVSGERSSGHRVRDVVVEPGEEPEAMLPGQISTADSGCSAHRDAARFAAEFLAFVDGHVEASLGQLVCRSESGHASAEDGDRLLGSRSECRAASTERQPRHNGCGACGAEHRAS